ncbi:SspB family protein [Parvularcula sp. IMCC14364]|uniref:SspB family protein n=1 Tax=Parvularcula sp. IMCC14364 TaxID=3067902 RepID=UPI00274072FA|nr:ClpXP protease specificity-enhancing factor SspB [Parvularcula sp. IMCC14364]
MTTNDIELDYAYLTQQALRRVVRDVLSITKELGDVPGDHHFYIEFLTRAPGVNVSDGLLGAYPERMTIVLQHKFEDLQVHEDHFEVTLHFKGEPDRLIVPYDALTNFVDPSCDYALRFEPADAAEDAPAGDEEAPAPENTSSSAKKDESASDDASTPDTSAEVVSLDAFRKK